MGDRKGDKAKQPTECKIDENGRCPNMKEVGGGFDGERYSCDLCGESYYLDYEEMK